MAWGYKATITIDHTKCGTADSSNFPVLISGTYDGTGSEPDLRHTTHGGKVTSTSGYDICFYSDSGLTTQLDHEIESYNHETGAIIMWVRLGTLHYNSDDVIYMAYGDSGVTTSQEDAAGTWTAYTNVYHFETLNDSKGGNNLTNSSCTKQSVKVGNGYLLDTQGDYLIMDSDITYNSTWSVEFWSKKTGVDLERQLINNRTGGSPYSDITEYTRFEIYSTNDSKYHIWSEVDTTELATLIHWTLTNGATGGCILYQNTTAQTAKTRLVNDFSSGKIGRSGDGYVGQIDELRFCGFEQNTSWITANYNTMNDPSTFYAMGDETANSTGTASASVSPSASESRSPSVSESRSPSVSPSPSASPSRSPSISASASPSEGYQAYTRGDYASLPTNNNDLEISYSAQDYTDVSLNDTIRVGQTATGQYAIHQFKDFVGSATSWVLIWDGQSDLAPSASKVVLQIYDVEGGIWEDVAENSTTAANTDFTLTGVISSDADHYKNVQNVITCRVYQLAV